ncbi:MAG: hypothetical protein AAGG38_13495 [Planctomycetota bacterium]
MPLDHARPGQTAVPTGDYNAMIDMARNFYEGRHNTSPPSPHAGNPAGQIYLRNDSGEDVPRFGVLGIDGPLIDPADHLDAFKNQPAFLGVLPAVLDHADRFAVCVEPIADGQIGRAKIDGVVQVQVDKQTEDDATAGVADGDLTQLKGGEAGAQIVWAEAGTGTKWAVVRFGSDREPRMAEVTSLGDDYVLVKLVNAGGVYGPEFAVAKPFMLRHDADRYPNVDTLTSTDTNRVEVEDAGGATESWEIRPWAYHVGDTLMIVRASHTGLTVSSQSVQWIDLNIDGRAWADITGNVGSAQA